MWVICNAYIKISVGNIFYNIISLQFQLVSTNAMDIPNIHFFAILLGTVFRKT